MNSRPSATLPDDVRMANIAAALVNTSLAAAHAYRAGIGKRVMINREARRAQHNGPRALAGAGSAGS